ncbi:hypothetical protein M3Y94_00780900 [Aphelenchoides besseyi]|nr:hypothetical protein M3Y94_00780900 [Aphelenchoides besseyi]
MAKYKMTEINTPEKLKEQGNVAYQHADYNQAIEDYTEALLLEPNKDLKCILYKNRAMARSKVDDFEGAEHDCTNALNIDGVYVKALYQRALAREQLDKIGSAFKDAKEALRLQPKKCTSQRSL